MSDYINHEPGLIHYNIIIFIIFIITPFNISIQLFFSVKPCSNYWSIRVKPAPLLWKHHNESLEVQRYEKVEHLKRHILCLKQNQPSKLFSQKLFLILGSSSHLIQRTGQKDIFNCDVRETRRNEEQIKSSLQNALWEGAHKLMFYKGV